MGRVSTDKAESHAQGQRERVLDAAYECFVEHGFHQAGMAMISKKAGMSPGLIYRYFENKSAIIRGICQQQLDAMRNDLRPGNAFDIVAGIVDGFEHPEFARPRRMSRVLILEVIAEAARDEELALLVKKFDKEIQANLQYWVQMRYAEAHSRNLDPAEAQTRALSLWLMIEGVVMCRARDASLDNELLRRAVQRITDTTLLP